MSSKDSLKERQRQRATEEAEKNGSFIESNFSVYVVAIIILIAGCIVSALTEGWHINYKFNSIAIAFFGVGLIEFVSIYFGGGVVNAIRNGIMSQDSITKALFVAQLLLYLGGTYFSVSLTLSGAPDFYAVRQQNMAPPTLVDTDSIRVHYAAKYAEINQSIRALEATTWKGRIVERVQPSLDIKNQQLADLQTKETLDLNEAKKESAAIQGEWDQQLAEDQTLVMGGAGMGEVLKIVAIILIALFKEGRNKELGIHRVERMLGKDIDGDGHIGTPPPAHRPPGFHRVAAESPRDEIAPPAPTPRRPIGYRMPSTCKPKVDTTSVPDASGVANVSYTPAHEELDDNDIPLAAIKEKRFYADAKRQFDSYESNGRVKAETKEKNQAKFTAWMNHAKTNLHNMGYEIELVNRNWQLVKKF